MELVKQHYMHMEQKTKSGIIWTIFGIIFMAIFVIATIEFVSANQEIKTITFFGGYVQNAQANKIYNTTFSFDPLDGLSKIIYVKGSILSDIPNTNTQVYVKVGTEFCNPNYYNVPISNNYLMNFDCTNQINSVGNYTVMFMSTKDIKNVYTEWTLTYLNNPKGFFNFFGTEYWFGENGTIFLQLKDFNSLPINTGSCDVTIYYPDKTKWVSNFPMNYLNNSQGLYYLDVIIPQISGVYIVEAECEYDNLMIDYNPINITYDGILNGDNNLDKVSDTDCIFYQTGSSHWQHVTYNITGINKNNITQLKASWVGMTTKDVNFGIYNYNTLNWDVISTSSQISSDSLFCENRKYLSKTIIQNITDYINDENLIKTKIFKESGPSITILTDEFKLSLSLDTPQIADVKGSSEINVHNPDITRNIDEILNYLNDINQTQIYWFPLLNNNQTLIYDKLIEIQNNITSNYDELINISQQLTDHNSSVWNQLIEMTNMLKELNKTTSSILNNITNEVLPRLIATNNAINSINENINRMEDELNCVNPTDSDICYKLNLIQGDTLNLETNLTILTQILESHNNTVYNALDDIITIINIIDINTDSLKEGQESILNNLTIIKSNISTILTSLGVPLGSTLWGKLITLESLVTQINSTVNTINNNTDEIEILTRDVMRLVDCTNSSTGTVCNKMNSLSNSISNLQTIMEQNHSTIYAKLINTFNNVTNTYNKVNDAIGYLNCNLQPTDSVCWRLIDIKNKVDEINSTTWNILNNITLIIIPKLNTINVNTDEIKGYVDTLESSFNCSSFIDNSICQRLNLIEGYTDNIEGDISSLSTQLTNHNTDVINRFNSIDTNLSLIYIDTQNILLQQFGLTESQNITLYAIKILSENNQNMLLQINETINDIKLTQAIDLSTILGYLINITILTEQINSTVNTIRDNTNNIELLIKDVKDLTDCTNSDYGTVCNKLNSLSTGINDLQSIMEQNNSIIYTKLIETFNNVTNNYNKIEEIISYLNCNSQPTNSVCWRLTDIKNDLIEINETSWNTLNNITLVVIPKLNAIETNINEIKDYVDTFEDNFNCSSYMDDTICAKLELINNYTENIKLDTSSLSTQITNHDISVNDKFNSVYNNLTLIYSDTQFIRIQNFSGGEGFTNEQNITLYAIQTLVQENKNLLLSINGTVNEIKTIQATSLVTGALKIEHSTVSEYRRGEEGSSVVLVTLNGVPVSGVDVKGDYYYPNQSLWLDDAVFTEIGSTGMYYYNFSVPITFPEGVYKVKITAEQSTSGSSDGDNFDDGNADGWATTGATWNVTDEGPPQNYVYDKVNYGGFIFAYSQTIGVQTDFTMSAKVKAKPSGSDYVGVTFRYVDSGNNYIFYWRKSSGNYRLMKYTNGGTSTLAETPYYSSTINVDQWYNFTVVAEGSHFLLYVDDVLLIDYTDIGTVHEQGYIGAFAYNSIGYWDDFNVTASGTVDSAYSMIDFKIDNTIVEAIEEVNSTVSSILESAQENFKVELSDFEAIVAGKKYYAKINSFDFEGKSKNLSSLPTITVYDTLREKIIDEAQFSYLSEGLYNYSYTTLTSAIGGMWESVVTANYSGNIVYLNDYWEISGSPADVKINSITDNTIMSISASIEITNKGTQASDFEYVYCIVDTEENKCGGGDDIDYQSGTHYILAGYTWNPTLGLEVPSTGNYWFKIKAKALGEPNWAGASKQFIAIEPSGVPSDGGRVVYQPTCNPLWVCNQWSSCTWAPRTRTCVDINYCNSNEKPPLLLSCSTPLPSDRISGCVNFVELDKIILRWKFDILRFDILNEGIYKWKRNIDC